MREFGYLEANTSLLPKRRRSLRLARLDAAGPAARLRLRREALAAQTHVGSLTQHAGSVET